MKTNKEYLRKYITHYMKERNLGFVNINASMNFKKTDIILGFTEEEDESDPLRDLLN
jgi:hypothetical protein